MLDLLALRAGEGAAAAAECLVNHLKEA
ncbi:hypothetical protein ETH_00043790 [Eimeria tenella]|uniref:Uncharacterized protein n=1 Tax=Eimeria tenella TaxID=5802 RepID=U6L348_EIMTE|nr:hypothetical protein ETH_00043790 [Eimeria tenella]